MDDGTRGQLPPFRIWVSPPSSGILPDPRRFSYLQILTFVLFQGSLFILPLFPGPLSPFSPLHPPSTVVCVLVDTPRWIRVRSMKLFLDFPLPPHRCRPQFSASPRLCYFPPRPRIHVLFVKPYFSIQAQSRFGFLRVGTFPPQNFSVLLHLMNVFGCDPGAAPPIH